MATYKVPQDVEAEDKLLGPFSFRQFIYLIVAALGIFLAYTLGHLFLPLAIIPAPVIIFFLLIALPLKRDQPMETYFTAVVHYLLKPHIRLWDAEGDIRLVEITAEKTVEGPPLKDIRGQEASDRLRYLSQVVDTGGWASRGITSPTENLRLDDTVVAEAQGAEDVFDTSGTVAKNFDTMISRSDQEHKQAVLQSMQNNLQKAQSQTSLVTQPAPQQKQPVVTQTAPTPQESSDHLAYNPYPSSIHQRILSPDDNTTSTHSVQNVEPVAQTQQGTITQPAPQQKQPQASSEETVSPDIMRLATSKDLSISTIAREADRLQKRHLEEQEVIVSLR